MKHSPHNLVIQGVAYLECSYELLFTFGLIYNKSVPTRELVEFEFERWSKTSKVPDWLEDFILDLFNGKARVDFDVKTTEWQVVRVRTK